MFPSCRQRTHNCVNHQIQKRTTRLKRVQRIAVGGIRAAEVVHLIVEDDAGTARGEPRTKRRVDGGGQADGHSVRIHGHQVGGAVV